jgi:hypothetical protein
MPFVPRASTNVTATVNVQKENADTSTPFDVTLATPDTAEDLVTVPGGKKGRSVDFVNEGPGDVAVKFDGTATVTDILITEGSAYSASFLEVSTKVSFINVTPASSPNVHGVLWSGAPST